MATKYPENLLSTRYVKGTLDDISWSYQSLAGLAEAPGADKDSNVQTRRKLAEIKFHFARANSFFYTRKFQQALDEYKVTQGLVYGLIQPSFNPDLSLNPALILPLHDAVFSPLLNVSLNMVAQIAPNSVWSNFGGSTAALPASVKQDMEAFTNLGVGVMSGVDDSVREAAFLGVEASQKGDWKQAEHFFNLGLRTLGDGQGAEAQVAKASMQMNLGVVVLQAGKPQEAKPLFDQATAAFQRASDRVGQAQATMNLAAAATKMGNANEAEVLLKSAETLLNQAEGRPSTRPPAAPRGSVNALRNLNLNMSNTLAATSALNLPPSALRPDLVLEAPASVTLSGIARPTVNPSVLSAVPASQGLAVTFRLPTAGDGWAVQDLESNIENQFKTSVKQLKINTGDGIFSLNWKAGEQIDAGVVTAGLYDKRIASKDLAFVGFRYDLDSDFAAKLPHMYFFSLPVAMGDCYQELGDYNAALAQYTKAAEYKYLNTSIEAPALWLKIAENYLAWGNDHYKQSEVQTALDVYSKIILPNDTAPNSLLYQGVFATFGNQIKNFIAAIANPDNSALNPKVIAVVLGARNKLKMIAAGLDFWGYSANHFPIFKFDYLQSIATYFAQQAVQAEREFINFTARGEDEELTREQLTQAVEVSKAEVDLAKKQVEQAVAEVEVTQENAQLADVRLDNAHARRDEYADVAYEMTALEAASVFASGPEGYKVSYTYYSPSEGKNVTLSGSDAYKVMEEAAWKRGMLSREFELHNIDRDIAELQQNQALAASQQQAAEARLAVTEQQKKIAEMNQKHAEELMDSFESQLFTPEVWFQLGNHMKAISASYLAHAIGVAKKMQQAYELETGFNLTTIKSSYTTNIVSGLLSADYLLRDVDYFTIHRINNTKSKDIPIKQELSLASLSPIGFETTFKSTGRLEFETNLAEFDRVYPGAYLRKIKKVEVIVEGLLPPGGIHGTLKNSGISRDRKRDGTLFFRVQPKEALFLSQYNPRADLAIFQPDPRVLDVFEHCGVATGWTLELPPGANDVNFQTVADVKLILYYTAQHSQELEKQIKATLPLTGESSTGIPFRLLFPDEFFSFLDSGNLVFELRDSDFAFNQVQLKVKNVAVRAVTHEGTSSQNITVRINHDGDNATATTDASGMVKSDAAVPANPLNLFAGSPVSAPWTITISAADNPGLDRSQIRDLFLFLEYGFTYRV